jgi:prepilin-type N-terminal cleavage/methylation domain-containing protein
VKTAGRLRFPSAFTLVEVMVAVVVLTIAAIGALGYQYYAAKQAYLGSAETIAARTALLLLDDWRSTGGRTNYSPTILGLGFSLESSTPPNEAVYAVTVSDLPMLVQLTWENVDSDSSAEITLRQLTVAVSWAPEEGEDVFDGEAGAGSSLARFVTYVRSDASGG